MDPKFQIRKYDENYFEVEVKRLNGWRSLELSN